MASTAKIHYRVHYRIHYSALPRALPCALPCTTAPLPHQYHAELQPNRAIVQTYHFPCDYYTFRQWGFVVELKWTQNVILEIKLIKIVDTLDNYFDHSVVSLYSIIVKEKI